MIQEQSLSFINYLASRIMYLCHTFYLKAGALTKMRKFATMYGLILIILPLCWVAIFGFPERFS